MNAFSGCSRSARGLLVAAAFVIVVAGLHAASSLLAPILLAVFIAVVATPPLRLMRRLGAPKWVALLVIGFLLLDFGSLVAMTATGAVEGFKDSLPSYQERVVLLSNEFGDWLEGVGVPNSREAVPDIFDPALAMGLTRSFLSNVSGLFSTGLLVLFTVILLGPDIDPSEPESGPGAGEGSGAADTAADQGQDLLAQQRQDPQ